MVFKLACNHGTCASSLWQIALLTSTYSRSSSRPVYNCSLHIGTRYFGPLATSPDILTQCRPLRLYRLLRWNGFWLFLVPLVPTLFMGVGGAIAMVRTPLLGPLTPETHAHLHVPRLIADRLETRIDSLMITTTNGHAVARSGDDSRNPHAFSRRMYRKQTVAIYHTVSAKLSRDHVLGLTTGANPCFIPRR